MDSETGSVDTSLISDLRPRLAAVFGKTIAAEMAILRTGGSIVLAQFNSANAAKAGAIAYATAMLGAVPDIDIDGTRTITRPDDVVKLVVAGRTMVAYSAINAAAAEQAVAISPIVVRISESEAYAKWLDQARAHGMKRTHPNLSYSYNFNLQENESTIYSGGDTIRMEVAPNPHARTEVVVMANAISAIHTMSPSTALQPWPQ